MDGITGLCGPDVSSSRTSIPAPRKERIIKSTSVADIEKEIAGAISDLGASRKVLIIDQLDALLAITDESTTSQTLQNSLLSLRSVSRPPFSFTRNVSVFDIN